ncbi:unnamed protein product [Owenia fusiformis]|uniref:Hydroxylysine kinase n=1 Tax=Owenia fusiformis TaxID=6347 RepID=A0A8J1XXN9_OWEFU|nr:unnamed protein product [Owenia fusiformis]
MEIGYQEKDTELDTAGLQQSNLIKPQLNETVAKDLVKVLYGMEVIFIKEMPSYNDRNFFVMVKIEHDNNNTMKKRWPYGYTLKITNSLESRKSHIDAEHKLQRVLHNHGIPCPQPVPNVLGREKSLQVIYKPNSVDEGWMSKHEEGVDRPYKEHVVRLLTYIPGEVLLTVPYTPSLFYNAGQMLGKIDHLLKETTFDSSTYADFTSLLKTRVWDLTNTPETLKKYVHAVADPQKNALIHEIRSAFQTQVEPLYYKMTKGIIHGDFNEQNVLVRESNQKDKSEKEYDVCGVLDFQDSTLSYYIFDVAISVCYLMVECNAIDPLDVGGYFLAGYTSYFSLNETDLDVLKICIASRLAMSMVMGAYTSSLDPDNKHILTTQENGWKKLKIFWPVQKKDLYERWKNIIASYRK